LDSSLNALRGHVVGTNWLKSDEITVSELKDERRIQLFAKRWITREIRRAGGGNRTHTGLAVHWILSPARESGYPVDFA